MNTGLYWFTNDLQIKDNRALLHAAEKVQQLLCVYIVDPAWFVPNRYGQKPMGDHRWRFLQESLTDLEHSLNELDQQLLIVHEPPLDALAKLIAQYNIDGLFRSQNAGFYENEYWRHMRQRYRMLHFEEIATHTLFSETSLPFFLADLPVSFSKFRKLVEPLINDEAITSVTQLPPPLRGIHWGATQLPPIRESEQLPLFKGGGSEGNKHLLSYFSTRLPSTYKQVRNALDGWENSTKFSPWLANGSLSVRQILRTLRNYEVTVETNEST